MSDLREGQRGKGYTVVSGTDVASFDVEILGVLPDGIALGVDFILIEVSGPVIDEIGGIAAGFSGSPVYLDNGDLVGALAYGFWGAPRLGGVTPAESMVEVLDYPGAVPLADIETVKLPDALRRRAAAALDAELASVPTSATRLPVPVGVSGVSDRGLQRIRDAMDERGVNAVVYAMARGNGSGTSSVPILPGDSMAVVMTRGDVESAGIGTATFCLDDEVMGWGHPFDFKGATELGMGGADVVTIVPGDDLYKLATLGDIHGTITQDRMTGMLGTVGEFAAAAAITSHATAPELGNTRDGRTDVYSQEWLGEMAIWHLDANHTAVFDAWAEGSAYMEWTISGRRQDGTPFRLERDNRYYSQWDVGFEAPIEMAYSSIDPIIYNPFEEVTIETVDVSHSELVSQRLTADIVNVSAESEDGFVFIEAGDTLLVDVDLQPFGGAQRTVTMEIPIPEDVGFASGSLLVRGGGGYGEEFYGPFEAESPNNGESNGDGYMSFDDLLDGLANADHNYDLVADLELYLEGEPPPEEELPPEEEPPMALDNGGDPFVRRIKVVEPQNEVVFGEVWLDIIVTPAPEVSCAGFPADVVGSDADDVLLGTPGDDVIVGRGGDDEIRGLGGNDVICGGRGADLLFGGSGENVLIGGRGRDVLKGGSDTDLLVGRRGPDEIWGYGGADTLLGRPGKDVIHGGAGNDFLNGGKHHDVLAGGSGNDVCTNGEDVTGCEGIPRGAMLPLAVTRELG